MKQFISHDDFTFELLCLIGKINHREHNFRFVLGIKNGGLHLSEKIAEHFKLPHYSIKISFYNGDKKMDAPVLSTNDITTLFSLKDYNDGKFLWVDDIVDSGSTLKWFIENTNLKKGKDFHVASMHWCAENSPEFEPEYYIYKKHKEDWIVYPWEVQ